MLTETTPRTLDITNFNDDEMDLLLNIAADPSADPNDYRTIKVGCRPKVARQILAFHKVEITPAWAMALDTLRGDYDPNAPSGPVYQLDLTDSFGRTRRSCELYKGPTARKDARAMARYIRNEIYRGGCEDGDRRSIVDVRVVPYERQD